MCLSLTQASQPDELTIDEQEMLEVIEDGDMEDWVKVNKHNRHYLISSAFLIYVYAILLDLYVVCVCVCSPTYLSILCVT